MLICGLSIIEAIFFEQTNLEVALEALFGQNRLEAKPTEAHEGDISMILVRSQGSVSHIKLKN